MSTERHVFDDRFSALAPLYADVRPRYPERLFAWLASFVPPGGRALDCGTGNGQAAVDLARFVGEIIAIDPSAAQIEHAIPHERVRYAVAPAEATGLDDASVDLVTCATSMHWFDAERFAAEVRRILKPGGVIAAWTYEQSQVSPEIDAMLARFAFETLDGYWSPRIRYVFEHYRTLPFPFEEIDAPELAIESSMKLEQMLGFLSSWSATRALREARGTDPVAELAAELRPLWGDAERPVRWPLHLRAGRVPS